ncbi:MAG TPA: (2Fe-2S)-binding protein [Casimicrobiaceae bacterium]|nr:(2Fe-2S)-binding protein [Casimicrobiaceae bacterium]
MPARLPMIVCVCNAVSDREIRRVIDEGAGSFEAVQRLLGVATSCGRCEDCARAVVDDALARHEHAVATAG